MYSGQSTLTRAIELYRARLSGRGPLARVCCTFHSTESCSSYGLRVSRESTSLVAAVRLIRDRIRRCGSSALYRTEGSTGPGLLWGELYDELNQPLVLDVAMQDARELEQTRRAVVLAAGWVARQRADGPALGQARSLLHSLGGPGPRLRVRHEAAFTAGQRIRARWKLALAACCAVSGGALSGALFEPRWVSVVTFALIFTAAGAWLAAVLAKRQRRLDDRAAVAEFSVF